MPEFWGMRSTPLLLSLPGSLWTGMVHLAGQIELNCILRLIWKSWKRTILPFRLHTYAKLNCLKWPGVVAPDRALSIGQIELNSVHMLNWIVWTRTIYMYKMDFALITYNGWCGIKPNQSILLIIWLNIIHVHI